MKRKNKKHDSPLPPLVIIRGRQEAAFYREQQVPEFATLARPAQRRAGQENRAPGLREGRLAKCRLSVSRGGIR
jgi:hypothetical protein